ncbi:hypothetical protein B0T21DRAFT_358972 [Apiosordaria backusii]|uniref:Uncharacterized protein n=1 Tax=Apiosordaria backusii TaxID=314023 RepID=A0AA40ET84_9PEZI|nr:hypothetical protein B0T21DRAFT_358972 [Apiosordaria backusii]
MVWYILLHLLPPSLSTLLHQRQGGRKHQERDRKKVLKEEKRKERGITPTQSFHLFHTATTTTTTTIQTTQTKKNLKRKSQSQMPSFVNPPFHAINHSSTTNPPFPPLPCVCVSTSSS